MEGRGAVLKAMISKGPTPVLFSLLSGRCHGTLPGSRYQSTRSFECQLLMGPICALVPKLAFSPREPLHPGGSTCPEGGGPQPVNGSHTGEGYKGPTLGSRDTSRDAQPLPCPAALPPPPPHHETPSAPQEPDPATPGVKLREALGVFGRSWQNGPPVPGFQGSPEDN